MTWPDSHHRSLNPFRSNRDCLHLLLFTLMPLAGCILGLWAMPETRYLLRYNQPSQILGIFLAIGQLFILMLMFGRGAKKPRSWYTLALANLVIWPLTGVATLGPVATGAMQSLVITSVAEAKEELLVGFLPDPAGKHLTTPDSPDSSTVNESESELNQPTIKYYDASYSSSPPIFLTEPPQGNTPEAAARRFIHALLSRNIPEISRTCLSAEGTDILYRYQNPRLDINFPTLKEKQLAALNMTIYKLNVGNHFEYGGEVLTTTSNHIGPDRTILILLDQLIFAHKVEGIWKVDVGPLIVQMVMEKRNQDERKTSIKESKSSSKATQQKSASGKTRRTGSSNLELEAAFQKAKMLNKIVLVYFYTTWGGQCKKMDLQTWQASEVKEWMSKHAVFIELDGDKQTQLTRRYQVITYPTTLFLMPDGSEISRAVGYRSVSQLLAVAGTADSKLTR